MAILYLFIVLKIGPEHDLHQKMPLETACSEAMYMQVLGSPDSQVLPTDCDR